MSTRRSQFLSVGIGAGMPSPFGGGSSGGMAMSPFGLAVGGDRTPGKILDPVRFRNMWQCRYYHNFYVDLSFYLYRKRLLWTRMLSEKWYQFTQSFFDISVVPVPRYRTLLFGRKMVVLFYQIIGHYIFLIFKVWNYWAGRGRLQTPVPLLPCVSKPVNTTWN